MKRPSIYDPRVHSLKEQVQPERVAPTSREQPGRGSRPSLFAELPVEACTTSKALSKRKRVENEPAQRLTRPRLSNDIAESKKPIVPTAGKKRTTEDITFAEHMPLTFNEEVSASLSPTRKRHGNQEPVAPQADANRLEQPILPAAKAPVSTAEAVKSRKAVSKPKPKPKPVPAKQQQQPHAAVASSPKKAPAAVKREAKGTRQRAGACKSCRSRHQKCDRTQPTCERCAKSGTSCEYPQTLAVTAQSAARASSPKRKQALLPIEKSSNEAGRASVRERSVTISPAAPRQKGPTAATMPSSSSKKPTTTAAPTAASSRAPRAKNTQTSRASPKKK